MPRRIAVVTDSTASLPAGLVEAADLMVVPLEVVVEGTPYREGVDLGVARLVEALRSGASVSTAQPGPEAFARTYARAIARGADEIVSVHLSGTLSGTVASAEAAGRGAAVPVHVVDSGTVGMGLGFAALAAARFAARADADEPPPVHGWGVAARDAARARAARSSVLFAVDSLDHLRRGGRLSPLAAALGTVLGLRPVLGVRSGRLDVVEKARTARRARERLLELSVEDAGRRTRCDVAVQHLEQPEVAAQLAEELRSLLGAGLGSLHVAEVSAVLGAHVGPGVLCVVVVDA